MGNKMRTGQSSRSGADVVLLRDPPKRLDLWFVLCSIGYVLCGLSYKYLFPELNEDVTYRDYFTNVIYASLGFMPAKYTYNRFWKQQRLEYTEQLNTLVKKQLRVREFCLTKEIHDCEDHIQALNEKHKKPNKTIIELQAVGKVDERELKMIRLQLEMEDLKERFERQSNELTRTRTQLADLSTESNSMSKDLKAKVKHAEVRSTKIREQLSASDKKYSVLEKLQRATCQSRDALASNLKEFKAQIATAGGEKEILRLQLKETQAEVERLTTLFENAKAAAKTGRTKLNRVNKQVEQATAANGALERAVKATQAETHRLTKLLEEATTGRQAAEVAQLAAERRDHEEQVTSLTKRLNEAREATTFSDTKHQEAMTAIRLLKEELRQVKSDRKTAAEAQSQKIKKDETVDTTPKDGQTGSLLNALCIPKQIIDLLQEYSKKEIYGWGMALFLYIIVHHTKADKDIKARCEELLSCCDRNITLYLTQGDFAILVGAIKDSGKASGNIVIISDIQKLPTLQQVTIKIKERLIIKLSNRTNRLST